MATIQPTGSQQSSQGSNPNTPLRGLDMDHFLTLMITELQNQDPLNPMENAEILQQISQIREIEATSRLQETLESVLLGQNLSNASSLLDKRITALTDAGEQVQGKVDRVSVADNKVKVSVGGTTGGAEQRERDSAGGLRCRVMKIAKPQADFQATWMASLQFRNRPTRNHETEHEQGGHTWVWHRH